MIFCFVWSILNFISGSVLGYAATQQEIATFGWAVAGVNLQYNKFRIKFKNLSFSPCRQCVSMDLIVT
jgi:hypothetical protein